MTTKGEIREALAGVTHASQNKAVIDMLLAYLDEAGVQTPAEKEAKVNEERHQQVAQAETVEDLDAVVEGWGADFQPDADLERAVDERDAYLTQQEATDEASGEAGDESADAADIQVGDYVTWDKPKLVGQARQRGLPVSGSKDELVARLAKDDEKRAADAEAAANKQPE